MSMSSAAAKNGDRVVGTSRNRAPAAPPVAAPMDYSKYNGAKSISSASYFEDDSGKKAEAQVRMRTRCRVSRGLQGSWVLAPGVECLNYMQCACGYGQQLNVHIP